MNEQEFWQCISLIDHRLPTEDLDDKTVQPLIRHLSQLSISEIQDFFDQLASRLYDLDTRAHYVACVLNDDFFLAARCYVVAQGREFYYQILTNPRKMVTKTFRYLLSVPSKAWGLKTCRPEREWKYSPARPFATYSNRERWQNNPHTVASIEFQDTPELIQEMLDADRSEKASIGVAHLHIGRQFASALVDSDFATPGYRELLIRLTPFLNHGFVKHTSGDSDSPVVEFNAGVRPRQYIGLNQSQRSAFFLNLIFSAFESLAERDNLDMAMVQQARQLVSREH